MKDVGKGGLLIVEVFLIENNPYLYKAIRGKKTMKLWAIGVIGRTGFEPCTFCQTVLRAQLFNNCWGRVEDKSEMKFLFSKYCIFTSI